MFALFSSIQMRFRPQDHRKYLTQIKPTIPKGDKVRTGVTVLCQPTATLLINTYDGVRTADPC